MVQEIILEQLMRQLGPAGRIIRELIQENEQKDLRIAQLEGQLAVRRPMKARSPADWRFRVLSWQLGEMQIFPRDTPAGKMVPSLRVHVPLEDKPADVPYWDITSKKLIATLLPILPSIAGTNTYVHIHKDGEGVSSSYSVSIQPA
jgi:hypothetical protein